MAKLTAILEFYDSFSENIDRFYSPTDQLTVGESSWQVLSLIQYFPNKPAKYGLQICCWFANILWLEIKNVDYCGTQHPGTHEALNVIMDIINRLISSYKVSNRNLTTDHLYTSCPLSKSFLASGITFVDTLQKNEKEIFFQL